MYLSRVLLVGVRNLEARDTARPKKKLYIDLTYVVQYLEILYRDGLVDVPAKPS